MPIFTSTKLTLHRLSYLRYGAPAKLFEIWWPKKNQNPHVIQVILQNHFTDRILYGPKTDGISNRSLRNTRSSPQASNNGID